MAPTAASNVHTATNVTGSVARTLNNIPPSTFVNASDPATPSTSPASTSFIPCPTISFSMSRSCSPERHADAELARALRDKIRHHTVESDDREHERGAGKNREQQHRESLPADRARHALLQQCDIGNGKLRVQRGNPLSDGRQERHRRRAPAHCEKHEARGLLQNRHADLQSRLGVELPLLDVRKHAHDLALVTSQSKALPERILAGPHSLRQGFVDDRDRR